jgi:hypothetical protein
MHKTITLGKFDTGSYEENPSVRERIAGRAAEIGGRVSVYGTGEHGHTFHLATLGEDPIPPVIAEPIMFITCDGPHSDVADDLRPPTWEDVYHSKGWPHGAGDKKCCVRAPWTPGETNKAIANSIASAWTSAGFTARDFHAFPPSFTAGLARKLRDVGFTGGEQFLRDHEEDILDGTMSADEAADAAGIGPDDFDDDRR